MIAGRPIASIPIAGKQAAQSADIVVNAESGAYSISGFPAFGLRALFVNAESGAYSLTGFPAFGTKEIIANAESGAYTISGFSAFGIRAIFGIAGSGAYTITGFNAFGLKSQIGNAESGAYAITGFDSFGSENGIANAEPGTYAVSGFESFGSSGEVSYGSGPFTYPHELRKRKREAEKELNEQVKKTIRRIAKGVIVGKPATKELEQIKDFASLSALRRSVEFYAAVDKSLAMRKAQDNFAAQEAVRLFILEMERKAQQIEEDDIAFLMMQVVADIE